MSIIKGIFMEKNMRDKGNDCPVCGARKSLKRVVKDETFTLSGATLTIPNYVVWYCSKCFEGVVDNESLQEADLLLKEWRKKIKYQGVAK